MGDPERLAAHAVELARRAAGDPRVRARFRRGRKRLRRVIRAAIATALVPMVVIPLMISMGMLFGPRGVEGLIAAPAVLVLAWTAIWMWALKRSPLPQLSSPAALPALPASTGEWLDSQRAGLPLPAQQAVDKLLGRIDDLTPQLKALPADAQGVQEVKRLLCDELPALVGAYRKVPRALTQKPLNGGTTPEQQLITGLATVEEQLGRLHERIATEDLHALATQQRYLELKYKRDEE
jgi:hypothetical protein